MSIADGQAVLRPAGDGARPLTLDCTTSLSRLGARAYPPALKELAPKVPRSPAPPSLLARDMRIHTQPGKCLSCAALLARVQSVWKACGYVCWMVPK